MPTSLQVSEIYASIQGESTRAGVPCAFIRLTGCNLRCVWCDSAFTFRGGRKMTLDAVLAEALSLGPELVEVTGGEPLLQRGTPALVHELLEAGREVLVETSGSLDISVLDPRSVRIVDLKCPQSGELQANLWDNLDHLTPRDELKFVLAGRRDYEWAREVINERRLAQRCTVLLSPVYGALEPSLLAAWMLADRLPGRLNLQLHKVAWPPTRRGV